MRPVKVLGACVIAVLLSAACVSAASAFKPALGTCKPAEAGQAGKYADAGCTEKRAKGGPSGYEWTPATESRLRATGSMTFQTQSGAQISCTMGGPSKVRFTDPSTAEAPLWVLQNCSSEEQQCTAAFLFNEGEVNNEYAFLGLPAEEGEPTPGWAGKLGYIEGRGGPTPTVGLPYKVANHERLFEPVVCQGAIGTVWIGGAKKGGDSFVGQIGPVNTMTTEFTERFGESAPGIQSPASLEGRKAEYLEAFLHNHWERVAIVAELHYEVEEEGGMELKATT